MNRKKSLAIFASAALSIAAAFIFLSLLHRPSNPRQQLADLEGVDLVYSFDHAISGDTVLHSFMVRNNSSVSHKITNVRTTCGCTSSGMNEAVIGPKSSVEVPIMVSLQNLSGHQVKQVMVETDDPGAQKIVFTIKGDVKPLFSVSPSAITLSRRHPSVTLEVNSEDVNVPLNIERVDTAAPFLDIQRQPNRGGKFVYTIALTQQSNLLPPDQFNTTIMLMTSNARQPVISIVVNGNTSNETG